MREETVIIKEEIDIDDTKIKLELADVEEDAPVLELSCAGGLMKIIEERPNMITVPVNDSKSEDELKFIASIDTLDQQQKLFVTSDGASTPSDYKYQCKICDFVCENQLSLASHQFNHQLNKHFCSHGCDHWCNTLEEILEHEHRQHGGGINQSNCRICFSNFPDAISLEKHKRSHFFVRRFVCAICRRHFELHQGLQLHRQHSKEFCGQIVYLDTQSNVGQLVAINTTPDGREALDALSAELLCDVQIKSEPLEADEMEVEQVEQQSQLADVVIKNEPIDEHEDFSSSSSSSNVTWPSIHSISLPEQLRGKLRLPAIKKPLKSEIAAKNNTIIHANPTIQFVPVNKWKPLPMSNSSAESSTKRPNILKAAKTKNQQESNSSTLKKYINIAPKTNSNVASNILKVLPSNCMVFKLPPNTKIIKMPATASNANNNSCTIGTRIYTLSNAMTISAVPKTPVTDHAATSSSAKVASPPLNRNAYFSDLSLFETLPESRKIIAEFQDQIRSIEETCPFPGTVLQAPRQTTKGIKRGPKLKPVDGIQLPPTKMTFVALRDMRINYPEHNFQWECPKCSHFYEEYAAFCNHLTFVHSIPPKDLEHLQVNVKAYPKAKPCDALQAKPEPHNPPVDIPVKPSPIVAAMKAAKAVSPVAPVAKHVVPAVPPSQVVAAVKSAEAPKKSTKASNSTAQGRSSQFQCDVCAKCFTTFGALRIHKMIHTGELPHKCNYCDKRFRTPGQVRVHQRRHTGEKPFKCKICSLDFTHRETLISHLSRHIGMKRYKCYGCDKNFVVVSGLRAHRRLRPDTCGKVKFTARAHGPRVRVIRGEVVFESHPEHNGYLRSEDPLNILSEMCQADKKSEELDAVS